MPVFGLSLDANEVFEFSDDPAKGTPEATRFHLATLDNRVMGKLQDEATRVHVDANAKGDDVETTINANQMNFEIVQFGLTNVENFKNPDGSDIEFKTTKRHLRGKSYVIAHEDVVARIPGWRLRVLAQRIRKLNGSTEEELKNSDE